MEIAIPYCEFPLNPYLMNFETFIRDIGMNIHKERTIKNLKQVALANSSGMSKSSLSDIENGNCRLIKFKHLWTIGLALEINPISLIPISNQPSGDNADIKKILLRHESKNRRIEFLQKKLKERIGIQ
jgi:transcriptional regulator with XRE-family HTH domain